MDVLKIMQVTCKRPRVASTPPGAAHHDRLGGPQDLGPFAVGRSPTPPEGRNSRRNPGSLVGSRKEPPSVTFKF